MDSGYRRSVFRQVSLEVRVMCAIYVELLCAAKWLLNSVALSMSSVSVVPLCCIRGGMLSFCLRPLMSLRCCGICKSRVCAAR